MKLFICIYVYIIICNSSITQEDVNNRPLCDYIRDTSISYLRKYQSKSNLIHYINEKHLSSVLQLMSIFDTNNQYSNIIAENVVKQYDSFFDSITDADSLMQKYQFLTSRCDVYLYNYF